MRLTLFLTTGISNIWCTSNSTYCRVLGEENDKFTLDKRSAAIIAFDKQISNRFSLNVRTDNMVLYHTLSLTIKYRFEKFVINFFVLKVFGDFYFPNVFIVIAESL